MLGWLPLGTSSMNEGMVGYKWIYDKYNGDMMGYVTESCWLSKHARLGLF